MQRRDDWLRPGLLFTFCYSFFPLTLTLYHFYFFEKKPISRPLGFLGWPVAHPNVPCISLLFLHVWFSPSLKVETAVFSVAWVPVHHTIRCHVLEDYSCKDISCFHRIWKFVTIFMGTHTQIMSKLNSLHSYTPCLSDFHFNIIVLSLLILFSDWNVEWFFSSLPHSPNLLVIVIWQLHFSFVHNFLSTLFPAVLNLFLL
jgi:hypothetical protein